MFGPRNAGRRDRAGLTLLELVVVMAILIAIAGILVPLLPDFMSSGNQAAGATNMAELEKALLTFRGKYFRSPNHFDSLMTEAGDITNLMPGPPGFTGGGALEVRPLGAAQAKCLSTESITMVYDLEDSDPGTDDFHPTLNPYVDSQPYGGGRTLAEGENVVMLKRPYDGVLEGVRLNEDHDYIVLGIGSRCSLCGADGIVKEAPIFHYPKSYGKSVPSNSYLRFCAVYDVGDPAATSTAANAKFVCCVGITTGSVSTAGDLVSAYLDKRFDMAEPDE